MQFLFCTNKQIPLSYKYVLCIFKTKSSTKIITQQKKLVILAELGQIFTLTSSTGYNFGSLEHIIVLE
jgi:hypothetical protein